ncbi:hypothetical protein ABZR37_13005 [Achromobacter ruhlandii]|uniref:hypothetical protein n=1 Tax=Achromobacter ruhlandii TaxID=72557 RepID=UPI003555C5F8
MDGAARKQHEAGATAAAATAREGSGCAVAPAHLIARGVQRRARRGQDEPALPATAAAAASVEALLLAGLACLARHTAGQYGAGTAIQIATKVRRTAVPSPTARAAHGRGAAAAAPARSQVVTVQEAPYSAGGGAGVAAIGARAGSSRRRRTGAAAAAIDGRGRQDAALAAAAATGLLSLTKTF